MPTEIDEIRRRLLLLGFALFEVGDGYVIKSLYLENISAGTEAEPLSLAEVRRLAA